MKDTTALTVTSAQLRAARAYLDWTMDQAAQAAGIAKRTVIRLERDERYAAGEPMSLGQLVAAYRARSIELERGGVMPLGSEVSCSGREQRGHKTTREPDHPRVSTQKTAGFLVPD